jgi:integrase
MPPGVQLRGAIYWHRVTIPKDLRHLYPRTSGGKLRTTHSHVSLETGDAAQAALRASWRKADLEAEFIAKREQAKAQSVRLVPTPELLSMLADRIRFRMLSGDGARRWGGEVLPMRVGALASPAAPMHRLGPQRVMEGFVSKALGNLASIEDPLFGRDHADFEAEKLGIAIDWTGQDAALAHLTRVAARAHADAARRTDGALITTPATPAALVAASGPVHLVDIVPDWKAKRQPSADAIKRSDLALRRLAESGMDKPINKYTKADGARLRDWFRSPDRGIGNKTAKNLWSALGALMNIAAECEKIETNPWAGLEFEVSGSGQRDEFTSEQLRMLFGSSLFTQGTYRSVYSVHLWEAYYMTLLGLWTGARVGELGRLEVADVKTENSIAVLAIHEEAQGGSLETKASMRTLPVPPEVIRLGFLDFVADQDRAGQTKLFPSLHRAGRRPPGEVMSEWFRGYREDLGLPAGALNGFHKFRPTVRSALAAHGVGLEIADALTGHKAQGIAGKTTHVRPGTILEALKRPLYPFLELPRVYPTRD